MDLKYAIVSLDAENDDHWTSNGAPRMDALEQLMGDSSITRKDVTEELPNFNRDTALAALKTEPGRTPDPVEQDAVPGPIPYDEQDHDADAPADPGLPVDPDAPAIPETKVAPPEKEFDSVDGDPSLYEGRDPFSINTIPLTEHCKSLASMDAFFRDVNIVTIAWAKEKIAIEDKIEAMGRAQQMIGRIHTRARNQRSKGQGSNLDVREYLAGQAKVREERTARAKAFIDQGVDAKALAHTISGKSVLDAAMTQRKASPGTTRPDPRIPVKGTRQAGS